MGYICNFRAQFKPNYWISQINLFPLLSLKNLGKVKGFLNAVHSPTSPSPAGRRNLAFPF
ncbi:hypothetical protein TH63_10110 [Rufibacter radiotolerans]|uniref:Uncharacterized protein n=1 Tax=Rufibacter radiotolerans TaxID=1379910 RepID=A0A0H4VPQ9_9BACT|nr:hypothetical protein TH63_10110 [Rufibacter radiotolerans]